MPDTKTDWFVAAGAKSGDGSLDKPFHDPWLAVYCAAAGDVIHIAAGTYVGRYDRSSWVIDRPNLTVRGGYNRDFSSRLPWQTPTVFAVFSGYEYTRENNLLSGRDDHSGLLLDGLCLMTRVVTPTVTSQSRASGLIPLWTARSLHSMPKM